MHGRKIASRLRLRWRQRQRQAVGNDEGCLCGRDKVWATADNPRTESQTDIFRDMRKGLSKGAKISFVEDRRRAISLALDAAQAKDIVLIAGKGHETFQEVQYTAIPFDDRLVAGELLAAKLLSA